MTNTLPSNILAPLQAAYTYIYDIITLRDIHGENKNTNLIVGCDSFSRLHVISIPQATTLNRINRKLQSPSHTSTFYLNFGHSAVSRGVFSLYSTEKFLFAGVKFKYIFQLRILYMKY